MPNLQDLSASELLNAFRNRELSPVEVARACLDRISEVNPRLNAICLIDEKATLDAARQSEARWIRAEPKGLLDGVPVTIKDMFQTKGWPTLCGSRIVSREGPWLEDAPPVARLRAHGAVFVGKTTTSEFAHKGVGDSPLTGITRNPWDPARTPGGSSAGAAVAAATGVAPLNLGSDSGGSIRIPASFCGVFGLKPGFGRVPTIPVPVGALVAEGALTWNVRDAALMLQVIAEPDDRDPYAYFEGKHDFLTKLDVGLNGRKIAFARTISSAPVDREIASAVESGAQALADLGAAVEEIDLDLPHASQVYATINGVAMATYLSWVSDDQKVLMDAGLLSLISYGERTPAKDYAYAYHIARSDFGARMKAIHKKYDLLVLPTMPQVAFDVGLDYPGEQDGSWKANWTPFTFPFNLTGQPACSIPCGISSEGLPVGMQIVGPVRGELAVLQAARAYESAKPFRRFGMMV
jgi:aspartyl-tRNA(Asn)/glutamyl-tRNA(Gln) amidotransferase subunit A